MEPISLLHQWWLQLSGGSNLINLAVVILFSVLCSLKLLRNDKVDKPPSPPKLPIIGNLHQIGKLFHQSLYALSKKYGPLMLLQLGRSPVLVVSSAEIAEEIMKIHDGAFADRPTSKAVNVLLYDCCEIAFSPYSEYWRHMKKLCVVELLSQRRVQAFQFVRIEEVAKMVENIRASCVNNGAAIDLSAMFLALSTHIVSRSALGRLYETEQSNERFGELARKAVHHIGEFCFEDLFPSLRWIDALTGFTESLSRTSNALHDFLDKVIDEHQALKYDAEKFIEKDLVAILLDIQNNGKLDVNLTRENIIAILMDMFVGGTETSATIMEWAMAELVKNPTAMKKAQEEVKKVVGNESKVSEAHLNQMKYLKLVVKETLRLHPPVLVPRETCTSTVFRGYKIPPKTRVLINAWAIQRDPLLWDNPESFIPERYLDRNIDFNGTHSQLIPFGFGRRICPGISYASVAIEYVLANLLYWFDWKLPDGTTVESFDMSESYQFVVHKKLPLLLVPQPWSS